MSRITLLYICSVFPLQSFPFCQRTFFAVMLLFLHYNGLFRWWLAESCLPWLRDQRESLSAGWGTISSRRKCTSSVPRHWRDELLASIERSQSRIAECAKACTTPTRTMFAGDTHTSWQSCWDFGRLIATTNGPSDNCDKLKVFFCSEILVDVIFCVRLRQLAVEWEEPLSSCGRVESHDLIDILYNVSHCGWHMMPNIKYHVRTDVHELLTKWRY